MEQGLKRMTGSLSEIGVHSSKISIRKGGVEGGRFKSPLSKTLENWKVEGEKKGR